jgi:hypothetical protein
MEGIAVVTQEEHTDTLQELFFLIISINTIITN